MAATLKSLDALAAMSPAQLRAEWRRVFRKDTPPHSSDLLARAVSWRMQAKIHGDLSKLARKRLLQLDAQLDKCGDVVTTGASTLSPGTRLLRDWNGRVIEVTVLKNGYLFENRLYKSLSQVAEHVTGTHWSGPRFFGLKHRRKIPEVDQHGT